MSTLNETVTQQRAIEAAKVSAPETDVDAPDRETVEVYPFYANDVEGGVTLRIHNGKDEPADWIDLTLDQASRIAEDLIDVIAEVDATYKHEPKDLADAKASIGAKPEVTWWALRSYDPTRDDADREGQIAVRLVNSHGGEVGPIAAWFATRETAEGIVSRLNVR